ncbi:MAG: hypothetical protein WD036_00645 [Bauldia sp.]
MRIYVFKSEGKGGLRAFADDLIGSKLPDRFGPWRAIGAVAPDKDLPYAFSRDQIEKSIQAQGFELWRMRPKKQQPPIAPVIESKRAS